jgi:calcium-dependent protein kinase
MGGKNSKKELNKDLKKLGEEANKKNPGSLEDGNILIYLNNLISMSSTSNPEKDYDKIRFISKGTFSEITLVQNKISENKAIMKTIRKTEKFSEKMEKFLNNELEILTSLDHPNIINVFGFYSNENSYSYITEFCRDGDLYQQLMQNGAYDERTTAYIMYQILSAVNYFHNHKIINRGLSLDHIYISEKKKNLPTVKICYFGKSIMAEKDAVQNQKAVFSYYNAPEVINQCYNEKCDLWSCGVIMYFLLSARPPFGGENNEIINDKILRGKYDLINPPFNNVSKECLDLLKQLLEIRVYKRIDASRALNHPWFEEHKSKLLFHEINDESIIVKLIDNLKSYNNKSIIQKISMAYLIHNYPQMKDVVNAAKLFNKIDDNNDYKINKKELYNGLKIKYNTKVKQEDVDQIFKNIDINNNGYIDYEEFVSAAVNKKKFLNKNTLMLAFKFFDKNDSGIITFDEIENMFKESVVDKAKVHESLQNIMKEVDLNVDGKITFDEFTIIMKNLI